MAMIMHCGRGAFKIANYGRDQLGLLNFSESKIGNLSNILASKTSGLVDLSTIFGFEFSVL